MNRTGLLSGVGAFVLWGLLPIFWKLISDVPALETLAHRIVWSMVLLFLILLATNNWDWIRPLLHDRRKVALTLVASLLLSFNWGLFIWAINIGEILSASLGYYINPLLSVLIGVFFFREKLRPSQWLAIGIAASGVLWLTWSFGQLPRVGLALALSFGLYGALKKMAVLGSIEGLTVETVGVFLPALGYIIYLMMNGNSHFAGSDTFTSVTLAATGLATAIPLLLFAVAAQRIPLSIVGMLQYIAPTIQLLLGVFVYGEAFPAERFVGFAFIWAALIVFSAEGFWYSRRAIIKPAVEL